MALVDTKDVNALAASLNDMLPEEKANLNAALSQLGTTMKVVDDLAAEVKADLPEVLADAKALIATVGGIATKADAVLDRLAKIKGVQLVFDETPSA
jgi:ABC-type transporter Mla subunit MlaD